MIAPSGRKSWLELRIDIDPIDANSPVMDRVSGDLYDVNRVSIPGAPPKTWRVYQESWILDSPQVNWAASSVAITGTVRYWKSIHPITTIAITVPWAGGGAVGPAEVVVQEAGGASVRFSCDRLANSFRDLSLEVAECTSIKKQPVLPSYNLGTHDNRPTDLSLRTLDFTTAYAEAGVRVSIKPNI